MKRGLSIVLAVLLCLFIPFVFAIPKDFEVSNVYWAAEGRLRDSDGSDKPFLLGLVELSWEGGKESK